MEKKYMTQDSNKPVIIDLPLTIQQKGERYLSSSERELLENYIKDGGAEISLSTANRFFELYISGSDIDEILRLNPGFPKAAILWLKAKYDWDQVKQDLMIKMQSTIAEKVMRAQLDAASLYADMITAATKRHQDNLKKYIQTGDEKYLSKTMPIDNVTQLQKAVEGLQKVTGQDKNIKITKEDKTSVDINITGGSGNSSMSAETAAKILTAISEEKKSKEK
jgi:hypothetical protein